MYHRRTWLKQTGEGEANTASIGRLSYGHSSCKGHRPTMEDEICAKLECPGLPGSGFFGVFDGHGGAAVARYAAQVVASRIFTKLRPSAGAAQSLRYPGVNRDDTIVKGKTDWSDLHRMGANDIATGGPAPLPSLFNGNNEPKYGGMSVSSWPPRPTDSANKSVGKVLRESFLEADNMILNSVASKQCGTTACTVLITQDYFVFANLGDSRAVLASNDELVFATKDHKPDGPRERQRIYDAGGFVLRGRVCGSLAVARALGDHSFKRPNQPQKSQMVSPEPDICYVDRNHNLDEFLVIACDGVFDVMSNEAVVDFVRESMRHFSSLTVVASQLVEQALQRGSSDNISAMIIGFVDGSVQHHGKFTGRASNFGRQSVSPLVPRVPGSLPPISMARSPVAKATDRRTMSVPVENYGRQDGGSEEYEVESASDEESSSEGEGEDGDDGVRLQRRSITLSPE